MPVLPLFVPFALLTVAGAAEPAAEAPALRLKYNPELISHASFSDRRDGGPVAGAATSQVTAVALPAGSNRVELTHRLGERAELGGLFDIAVDRVSSDGEAPRSSIGGGVGLTGAYTLPLRGDIGAFAQGVALYTRSWGTTNAAATRGGDHGLRLSAALGLRFPLAGHISLDPALELSRGAQQAWAVPAEVEPDPKVRQVELRASARLGLSVRF